MKTVVRPIEGHNDYVRVYLKGAPEYILERCTELLQPEDGDKTTMSDDYMETIRGEIECMASSPCKVLSFAYKDMNYQDFLDLYNTQEIESPLFRENLEIGLTYVCTFGLDDPPRPGVEQQIQMIRHGKLLSEFNNEKVPTECNIRMVSGDHILTAK